MKEEINKKIKKNKLNKKVIWTDEENQKFSELLIEYGEDWEKISKELGTKTEEECIDRSNNQKGDKKGNWSKKEDQILIKWVNENGPYQWTDCSKLIEGRCGKQCRERWVNTLDPKVKKGDWNEKDQELIFELLKEHFTSWSSISKNIIGRTENSIKNFFYSSIRRLKSNSIINFLKDLQNQSLDNEKIENLINKMQIKSINYLCYLLVKFILKNDYTDQRCVTLRKFLCQILLEDAKKKTKKINIETKEVNYDDSKNEDLNLTNNETNIDSEDKTINYSINLNNLNNNSTLSENLNLFFELLNNLKYTNPSQKVKINIPHCWNCKETDNNHCNLNKVEEMFKNNLKDIAVNEEMKDTEDNFGNNEDENSENNDDQIFK